RAAWAEAFEREEKGLSGSADKPILAWSAFVSRLLASDSGQRFGSPAEAEAMIGPFASASWAEAAAALRAAQQALAAGDAEGCVAHAGPWADNGALPELCRERLVAWLAQVEREKAKIGRVSALRGMLADAGKALDGLDIER